MARVPCRPPPPDQVLRTTSPQAVIDLLGRIRTAQIGPEAGGKYRHWDNLRNLRPPDGLTAEEWWFGIKSSRQALYRKLPFLDIDGTPFVYGMPDGVLECLHYIDQHASGEIAVSEVVMAEESARRRYLVNSLMEEAIRSSQLEGANTTRPVARDMIRSGRPPRNRSERMILNNYRALQFIRHDAGDELTPEIVIELQRILTDGTLDNEHASGRLQTADDERIAVWDVRAGEVVHRPPPADQLEARLKLLCDFANEKINASGFMHPVVRSILLHFVLGYDHPFEDGNGRTARALFYWSMRKHQYWLTDYLSISRILRMAPAQYGRAYLHTESDDGDTTYFIVYNLSVIKRAIEDMSEYLRRKMREVREVEQLMRQSDDFNYRQLALLSNALRHPDQRYTFRSHAASHDVTRQSARTDLLDLVRRGLVELGRSGKEYTFSPVADFAHKLGQRDGVVG